MKFLLGAIDKKKRRRKKKRHSLALSLTRGLVESVAENGVLLLETGQLRVGAFLQLVLQAANLQNRDLRFATSEKYARKVLEYVGIKREPCNFYYLVTRSPAAG